MNRFESWSQRKRGLKDSQEATEQQDDRPLNRIEGVVEGDVDSQESPALSPTEPGAEGETDDLDKQLPDPDTLEPGSDFKPFLLPGVSPELKRRALRRMFSASNYNVRDGLDDYDQDYSKMRTLSKEVADQLRHWMDKLTEDDGTATPEEKHQYASQQEREHGNEESEIDDRQTARHSSGDGGEMVSLTENTEPTRRTSGPI